MREVKVTVRELNRHLQHLPRTIVGAGNKPVALLDATLADLLAYARHLDGRIARQRQILRLRRRTS